jgi:transposase
MNASVPSVPLFVGVDIAATSFAAAWSLNASPPQRARTFAQTPDGFAAFQAALASTGVQADQALIVLEATGSYWITLAVTLHQAGYRVSIVNPAHAHAFARSLPRRAKTDLLDAQLLAQFACERQPPRWTPPEQVYHELRQRLLVRDGLLEMRQQARNQRHALDQWPITIQAALEALDKVIAECDTQLQHLEREIARVLRDGAWARSAALLSSITGIGLVTTAWLLVATLNFEACVSAERAAAYAGLVPLAHESGTSVRHRAWDWPRRARPVAHGVVYGNGERGTLQSGHSCAVSAAAGGGQADKSGVLCSSAQAAASGVCRGEQGRAVRPAL